MTTPQYAAFWAWWKTGLTGSGKRSFRQTAKETGHGLGTITAWADEYGWSELATQKDMEIQSKLEDSIFKKIIDDNEEIISRQRKLTTMIYSQVEASIGDLRMNVDQLVKLMEYERTLDGTISSKSEAGASLQVIMQFMKPEARSDIFRAIGDARREGLGSFGR